MWIPCTRDAIDGFTHSKTGVFVYPDGDGSAALWPGDPTPRATPAPPNILMAAIAQDLWVPALTADAEIGFLAHWREYARALADAAAGGPDA